MGLEEKEDGFSSCPPSGLALLLTDSDSENLLDEVAYDDEAAAAAYVFHVETQLPRGDGLYSVLGDVVAKRAGLERVPFSGADKRPGRLGPAIVEVAYVVGELETSSIGVLTSTATFSSCRANACVFSGKWHYEVTICSAGIMQLGWATLQCPFTADEGVGDAPDSYAFDGKRVRKWHANCTQYGEAWAAGDVIGCCLDLDRGEATFYRNGRSLGVAFTGIRTMQPNLAYFPAVSLSYAERCELNFGGLPLQYPVPSFQPMQAAPHSTVMEWASFLVSSLERLVTTVQPQADSQDGAAGSSNKKAAAAAAAAAAAVTADVHRGCAAARPSFSVPSESWLLMGWIAMDKLTPFLLDSYIIASVLIPTMLRLTPGAGSGTVGANPLASNTAGTPLPSLLQLLEVCLEPEMMSAVVNCVLETLSRRCISAALVPEEFPYSASCPYLALAVAIASRPSLRVVWVRHPNLWQMLEGFLTWKGPSPDDLRQLLPHVWWRGCSELSGDRDRMRGALQALSTAITRVEDKQYELLCCLLGSRGPGESGEDSVLLEFLRYLVLKNKGANRDIPPPGLSDSTVLISAYFVLVRMLRAALPYTDTFSAGTLFVKTAMKADLEPINSLVRLGGIVTHLCRESPVIAAAELAPLGVTPPPRPGPSTSSSGGSGAVGIGPSRGGSSLIAGSQPSIPGPQLSPPPPSEADSLVISRVQSYPRLAGDLVDLAMTLYASQVGVTIRRAHSLGNTVAGSLAGLEEVERHLRRITSLGLSGGAGPGHVGAGLIGSSYANYLREARDVFRQEVSNNIRFSSLLKVLYFSGWKQEACLTLAGWMSRMLGAVAALPGPLLSYVPTCYLDCILDTFTSVRQASEAVCGTALPPVAQAPSVGALRTHGSLGDIIAVLVILLHEPRICTPDAKEAVVGALATLLDQPGMLAEVEASEVAKRQLVGAAVVAFDSRLWHPVSQVLLRLVRGQGFGDPRPGQLQQVATVAAPSRSGSVLGGSPLFRRLLVSELQPERSTLQPYLHRLFNMANWATSEFAATVADLYESRSRRHMTEQQQQFRKAGIMFELVAGLLRLLEFVTGNIPEAFLASGPHAVLNLNRLLEVVSFLLSHFTEGSDTRRLTELLTVPPLDGHGGPPIMSNTVRIERTLLSEKINKAQVLAPVVGALLGLWRSSIRAGCPQKTEEKSRAATWADSGRADSDNVSGGLCGSGGFEGSPGLKAARRNMLLDTLLRHWDSHMEKHMEYLQKEDWQLALPAAEPELLEAGACEFRELLAGVTARRQQLATSGEGVGGKEPPEELLDPITSTLMMDPVVLPDSQMTVDRSTIERHFLTSQTDPFSRTPLNREALVPNEEIKHKIAEWRRSPGGV